MNSSREHQVAAHVVEFVGSLVVLVGSMLVAVQFRLNLTPGARLGGDYDPQPAAFYALIVAVLVVVQALWTVNSRAHAGRHPYAQFWTLIVTAGVSSGVALYVLPALSQLQLLYFTFATFILGLITVVWPLHLRRSQGANSLGTDLARLWDNRSLLGLWLKYNIQSRYSQTVLGILWIVLLPLATSVVLTIAFTQFLRIQLDVPFIVFFLSALVPFGLFNQSVQNSAHAVVGALGLINQIYFPREILVLVKLGEALVDLAFTFAAMLLVNALYGFWPNEMFLLLPVMVFILMMFSLGIMLFVSSLSVLVRDVPQLVAVALQLIFYLTPVLYPVESFPDDYRFLILVNPIAPIVQAFRDAILYAEAPDPVVLYYPIVISATLLFSGYAFFKATEDRFADLQ